MAKEKHKSTSSHYSAPLGARPSFISQKQDYIIKIVLVIIGVAFLRYYQYRHVSANPDAKSTLPTADYSEFNPNAWASYRPQCYFGLKTRRPGSPVFGVLWYSHNDQGLLTDVRHWCNQDDGVHFMWEIADGRSVGKQNIVDKKLNISTRWFNRGNSWSSTIDLKRSDNASTGFILYFATQDKNVSMVPVVEDNEFSKLWIHSPEFTDFFLEYDVASTKEIFQTSVSYRMDPFVDLTKITEIVKRSLFINDNKNTGINQQIYGEVSNPTLFLYHYDIPGDAQISIEFKDEAENPLPDFGEEFARRIKTFETHLNNSFFDGEVKVPDSAYNLAKYALSNTLGGVGYWSGNALIKSKHWNSERVGSYGPLELLSAVPSRPFFPRGFIWDEGFHNLLIHKFDPELSLDILASWLNTMNVEGWIPREMILGDEAEAKVPKEFLIQSDRVANPPTFFYVLDKFVNNPELIKTYRARILSMYPRLKQWYIWLRDSQQGPIHGTFQWHGRNATTDRELNPKTLASGLDDYPRASHPTINEYHVDLRCWLAMASRSIRYLAELSSDNGFINEADADQRLFNDFDNLNRLHWSENVQRYTDYGHHSTDIRLETTVKPHEEPVVRRKAYKEPIDSFVENVNGYVSLFPFLLRLLPENSDQLAIILKNLDDTEELWSPYGLRSVSTKSPYYNKRNTKDDPPYWRGNVWININYMALESLKHYSRHGGANSERAADLYNRLKSNVVENIRKEFEATGFFWEHYSDRTGKGAGTRPFTGWTALVFGMITDNYD